MRILFIYFLVLLFSSCITTNYFKMYASDEIVVVKSPNELSDTLTIIPFGSVIYVNTGKEKQGYRKFKFGKFTGWTTNQNYSYTKPVKVDLKSKTENIKYQDSISSSQETVIYKPTGGSVYVKGYYRKDGTYVKPHTRKAPKKRR